MTIRKGILALVISVDSKSTDLSTAGNWCFETETEEPTNLDYRMFRNRIMELSLSRTFVPVSESSRYGTFAPGSENDVELSLSMRNC